MRKIEIPYKAHSNKYAWDYMSQLCLQLNNINMADNLESDLASLDNIIYGVVDNIRQEVCFMVSLSRQRKEDVTSYENMCDVWISFSDVKFEVQSDNTKTYFSFDIKKYNSMLSFTEDYQSRDYIRFYIENSNKAYYKVSNNNFIDISPIVINSDLREKIDTSYVKYLESFNSNSAKEELLTVESVDKNSFLLPFMSYRDFVNFATYSENNASGLLDYEGKTYFVDSLYKDNKCLFYMMSQLRMDKFTVNKSDIMLPPGLWQVLTIIQHYKSWQDLRVFYNNELYVLLTFTAQNSITYAVHTFNSYIKDEKYLLIPDLSKFELVGQLHSNELFRLNKLYSNANRTCYFDFSTQTFTGNNYVFNADRLEQKTIDLENKIETTIPLKITFTEIKHYLSSDLSQKNFNLKVFTDGVNVMLERWDNDLTNMGCRVIFNHTMSKKNQNL